MLSEKESGGIAIANPAAMLDRKTRIDSGQQLLDRLALDAVFS